MRLDHDASDERVSSGIERLDTMLGGRGYFRGGSVLISGTPGAGKTTLAAAFMAAGCARGERCALFAFEESPQQLMRNVRSVGIDLDQHLRSGLLRIEATRPAARGLEGHLASILQTVDTFAPALVVIDPISAFSGEPYGRQAMLTRLIDYLKKRQITAICTSLTDHPADESGTEVSSVIDAWLRVATVEVNGERNRSLRIIKARGTEHSNQVRELVFSADGISLLDVYTGSGDVVMGTARHVREAEDAETAVAREEQFDLRRRTLERQRDETAAHIAALQASLDAATDALDREERAEGRAVTRRADERDALRQARHGDTSVTR